MLIPVKNVIVMFVLGKENIVKEIEVKRWGIFDVILAKADMALYQAKRVRNKVETAIFPLCKVSQE